MVSLKAAKYLRKFPRTKEGKLDDKHLFDMASFHEEHYDCGENIPVRGEVDPLADKIEQYQWVLNTDCWSPIGYGECFCSGEYGPRCTCWEVRWNPNFVPLEASAPATLTDAPKKRRLGKNKKGRKGKSAAKTVDKSV